MSGIDYKLAVLSRDADMLGPNPKHTRYTLVKLENNIPVAVKTFEAEASFCFPSISPGYKR